MRARAAHFEHADDGFRRRDFEHKQQLKEGARVEARLTLGTYPGEIRAANSDGTFAILFDDGTKMSSAQAENIKLTAAGGDDDEALGAWLRRAVFAKRNGRFQDPAVRYERLLMRAFPELAAALGGALGGALARRRRPACSALAAWAGAAEGGRRAREPRRPARVRRRGRRRARAAARRLAVARRARARKRSGLSPAATAAAAAAAVAVAVVVTAATWRRARPGARRAAACACSFGGASSSSGARAVTTPPTLRGARASRPERGAACASPTRTRSARRRRARPARTTTRCSR